jgi:hypothetical protein
MQCYLDSVLEKLLCEVKMGIAKDVQVCVWKPTSLYAAQI